MDEEEDTNAWRDSLLIAVGCLLTGFVIGLIVAANALYVPIP